MPHGSVQRSDRGHTDQTCSKGSRHDLRTAMKKHLRSQSRQAGRQSSDQGNAGTVYSQKDCKHAGQKQLCPQKPQHGNRDRHDIFQRIMGRLLSMSQAPVITSEMGRNIWVLPQTTLAKSVWIS